MNIKYKLTIHYFGSDENGNNIDRIDNFIFENNNSYQNRQKVIKEYENYFDIFNDAHKFGKLKFSWSEVLEKNIKEFHIPTMNIYYTTEKFEKEDIEIVLFGSLLESFEERLQELIDEKKLYDKNSLFYESEILTDSENNEYEIIKGSLISNDDKKYIKNLC